MRRILLFFAIALCPICSLAQTTGFPPFGSFDGGGFDAVNRQDLNANFAIPIVSIPGRGTGFSFSIVYDTLIWRNNGGPVATWYVVGDPSGVANWGWKTKSPIGAIYYTHSTIIRHTNCGTKSDPYIVDLQTDTWSNYSYTDPAGTPHQFTVSYTDAQNCSGGDTITGTTTGNASDGSGFFMNIGYADAPIVITRSGTKITSSSLKDTNGNFITQTVVSGSETDWTDTANHTALRIVTVGSNVEYHYLDTTGTDQKYTLKYQNFSIKTAFGCTGVTDYNLNGTMPQVSLPYELDIPNGQKYLFAYEPTPNSTGFYTGRLTQVTLPFGGTVQYTYPATPNNGVSCTDGSVLNLTRTISDGTTPSTWTYARTVSGSGYLTTVTAPLLPYDTASNVSQFYFNSSKQDYLDMYYQGSAITANLRRTISTNWAANGTPSSRTVQFEDNSQLSYAQTTFDSNGNILTLAEYGSTGSVIRTTNWTYLSSSAYTAANILDHVTRVTVTDNATGTVKSRTDIAYDESGYINYGTCHTSVPQHDDAGYSCTSTVRGNPTTVTTYSNAAVPSGSITHHSYYDNLGNLVKADLDCCQSETWSFSTLTNYSFPDSATRGSGSPQLTSSATYNTYTGLIATSTDENGQVTTYTYDSGKRLTNAHRPDNANLTWTYNDAIPPSQSSLTAGVPIQGTSVQKTTTTVDALGRPILQQLSDGTTTYSIVKTQYDPVSRPYMTSNPYTSSASYWTTTQFDALGRPTKVILPDNSQTTYGYTTSFVTATDAAGKARKSQADGLGRMASVWEPDPSNGNTLTLQTSNAYNVLNLLTSVTQGVQSRTYSYDDLGRVTSVKTPETNQIAVGYQYNNFGLVTQRTDARGVITTYGYDGINRLQSISYNVGSTGVPATSSVALTYGTSSAQNNNGRVITMTDGVGSENYSYDILGRVTQLQKIIGTTTYTNSYGYNLASELTSVTYPSSRVVQPNYDAIGRLCSVGASGSGCSSGTTYASSFAYNTALEVTGFNYGNGVAASFGYSADRLQLTSLSYVKGATTLLNLTYGYPAAGSNNGQISGITDNSGTQEAGRSVTYSYDALHRLTSATTTGSTNYPKWGLSWAYDRYGNRLNQTQTFGNPPTNSLSFANPGGAQTNRPDNMCFDANGDLMTETSVSPCPPSNPTYTYDAENRLVNYMGSSATYTYDGKGLRAKKVASGTTTVYIFSGSKVIAEYDNGAAPASPSREYIYSGRALLAKIESGATTYFHPDHLSNRVLTDSSGNSLGQRGHYPFGETWYESGTTTKLKFTTYERDSESTNDYALARNYINRFGRFPSTDSLSGSIADPQSLNRYTYGLNVPVSLTDPSGMRASGCLILENHDADKVEQPAGGYSDDDEADFANPPPQSGCGHSTPGGFPAGGGDPFEIIWEGFTDFDSDQSFSTNLGAVLSFIGSGVGDLSVGGDPSDPCDKVKSSDIKYGVKQNYLDENGNNIEQTAQQHITQGHIFPGEAGNTMYIMHGPLPPGISYKDALWQNVQAYNAVTFSMGQRSIDPGNGNLVFTLTFPVTYNPYAKLPAVIGVDLYTSPPTPLSTNVLILKPDCKTARTSFATTP